MRARGAKVTDIVVLVVAADDGVMPQTKEAIDHAKAANVPIVVAINKIDKPNAQTERVKRELTELDLMPEEWGGQTVTVEVSARQKTGIDTLLEMILLSSDILELKANPKRTASGTVLEAKLDKGRGPVATVLVQDGTLHVGDTFIAGPIVGRVRALIDDRGKPTKSAGPSTPVEVLGLSGLPQPGDVFQVADAAKARHIATFREEQSKSRALGTKGSRLTLESLQAQIAEGGMKELPLIVKTDVQGSAEVLADTLTKLTDEKVKIRIIHAGVGAVNESDVLLASASNAIVIAFNVRPDRNAEEIAAHVELTNGPVVDLPHAFQLDDWPRDGTASSVTLDLTGRQAKLWKRELRPALAEAGVIVGDVEDCTPKELDLLEERFDQEIFPVLTPLAVGPGQPFPYISPLSLSLGTFVRRRQHVGVVVGQLR
jgi:translation initiation factor IF-2